MARRVLALFALVAVSLITFFVSERDASAVPSFARKYKTSCTTCHTVYPVLNPFGEAFRRIGYRFPIANGARDSDVTKAEMLPLGQEEFEKTFPDSVWPDQIPQDVPLSAMVNGAVALNIPGNEAHDAAGNTYTHDGIVSEFHLFAAGAFNDRLTYFGQLTLSKDGVDIETAYLLWNDVLGPDHLVNLWVGRLMGPSLNSFGLHSSYLSDTFVPATSIAGLYNPSGSFSLGTGHTDGVEVNGIAAHRFDYSLGWVASSTNAGLKTPNAEDVYAHVGVKLGGMSLDGEGPSGMFSQNAKKPWAETSLTIDAFAYHGLTRMDNGTGAPVGPTPQDDTITAIGGSFRGMLESLVVTGGGQLERHSRPYQGTPATTDATGATTPAAADNTKGKAITAFGEADYVVFPWLVPGVRAEYTQLDTRTAVEGADKAHILRLVPGVALAIRANIKVVVTAALEQGKGLPPTGSWGAAGGNVLPADPTQPAKATSMKAEQVNATLAWAFLGHPPRRLR